MFARHLLKLFHVSVMVAASSTLRLDEVGHSVFPYDVFSVKVLENARQHMRNVLMYKGENFLKCEVILLDIKRGFDELY